MRIIPVIDILDGVVVRGVAGRRSEYRPIESCLTSATDPVSIALAFRELFGLATIYVADLDAIVSQRPNGQVYQDLAARDFSVWVDAGLRSVDDAEAVLDCGASAVVAGLETWPHAELLHQLVLTCGRDRVIFSLDLRDGTPLADPDGWASDDPFEIADEAICAGVSQLIVLDIAHVGLGGGVATRELCRRLSESFPDVTLITGGGVRDLDDVRQLESIGVAGVLVASALHSGAIDRRQIENTLPTIQGGRSAMARLGASSPDSGKID
jgi:phosphoribosylformimino-5-aminoimidazole carboxamide ribotide isomerase